MDIATLSVESFEPLVGQSVAVETTQGPLLLRVERVETAGSAPEGMRAPFALTLTGPRTPRLNQGTWPITLPGLGETALFLSPYAQTDDETRYEVLFT